MEKKVRARRVKRNHPRVESAVAVWKKARLSDTDSLGSYTGVPTEQGDLKPEQDPDDL